MQRQVITIFAGDDINAFGKSLQLNVGEQPFDYTGCKIRFNVEGLPEKQWDGIAVKPGGHLTFSYTAEETKGLRPGAYLGVVRIFDKEGRQRTVTNTVRVIVTKDVSAAYALDPQQFDVDFSNTDGYQHALIGETFVQDADLGDVRAFIAKIARALGAQVTWNVPPNA